MTSSEYLANADPTPEYSDETLEDRVMLWYGMRMDELLEQGEPEHRLKWYCLRWLRENGFYPLYHPEKNLAGWHWFKNIKENNEIPINARVFPQEFELLHDLHDYCEGHRLFSQSIDWFCSLWPRFYVEVELSKIKDEPANLEEFWDHLELCVPGMNLPLVLRFRRDLKRWVYQNGRQSKVQPYVEATMTPNYQWTFGNAVNRAIRAWKGEG